MPSRSDSEPEYEITFRLRAGFDEQDATDVFERVDGHPATENVVLACLGPASLVGIIEHSLPRDGDDRKVCGCTQDDNCPECSE